MIEGQGSEQENGYGSYVFTDQDSTTLRTRTPSRDSYDKITSFASHTPRVTIRAEKDQSTRMLRIQLLSEPTFAAPSDQRPGKSEAPILVGSDSDSNDSLLISR